jgi:hypothetical protein
MTCERAFKSGGWAKKKSSGMERMLWVVSLLVCHVLMGTFWTGQVERARCRQADPAPPREAPPFEVCVVTARRPGNASYVAGHLASLVAEGVDPRDVTVVDVDAGSGAELQGFAGAKLPDVRAVRRMADCVDDGNDVETGVPCPVLQANYDMSMALAVCWEAARGAGKEWLLFAEDDVVACAGSLRKIRQRLEEARGEPGACMVRFGKGAMGYALRARHALDLVADIRAQAASTPHDLVVVGGAWSGAAERPAFGENLFHHVGEVSTIPYRNKKNYLDAYGDMRKDVCGQAL